MLSRILTGAASAAAPRFRWSGDEGTDAPGSPGGEGAHRDSTEQRRAAEIEQQMERRVRDAHKAGYKEGEAAGRAHGAADIQPAIEKLARGIEEVAALRPQVMRESAAELIELSLGIARRILHREVAVDPAALEGLIKVALEKLRGQEVHRLRMHPSLEPGVRQALDRGGRGGLPLVADGTCEPGAILIETARGKLDASIETQLAEIGRGLADRLPER